MNELKVVPVEWNRRLNKNSPSIYLGEVLRQLEQAKENNQILDLNEGEIGETAKEFAQELERKDDLISLQNEMDKLTQANAESKIISNQEIEVEQPKASIQNTVSSSSSNDLSSENSRSNPLNKITFDALAKLIDDDNLEKFNSEIKKVENLNILNRQGQSLLHFAIGKGKNNFAKILIKKQIDLNHSDYNIDTPLHFAVSSGNAELVGILIDKGAKVNLEDKNGLTPLMMAMNLADKSSSDQLITDEAKKSILDSILKKMELSDIKAQYLRLEDSGNSFCEEHVRKYLSTCRESEMKLRQEVRKNPSILLIIAEKLPQDSSLKNQITNFLESQQKNPESNALSNIVKNIVDAFRSVSGLDDLTKVVKKITNEPESRSNVERLESQRASKAPQSNEVG